MSRLLQRVAGSIFKQTHQLGQQARLVSSQQSSTPAKGLQQFFENGASLPEQTWTGRSWKASELRLKSFEDLHKLWYVLLKERNVLATQREEARRLGIDKSTWTNAGRCKKSMARIKFVLNERQKAYEEASRLAKNVGGSEAPKL
ncbi:mitochondrial 39-S ribosomal protein L47 (MRP-L47)-domain-containing protein [Umbelopsis sp. PMI_123]|nr:mitochondrial 39-S ribosomal protein L47 (MRP-L47)-domain-containing protein [Umbelopsis sp. PMI_123]